MEVGAPLVIRTTKVKQRSFSAKAAAASIIGLVGLAWLAYTVLGSSGSSVFRADLSGLEEVPPILTNGTGTFEARLAANGTSMEYELTFSNLASPSTAAHIHFGQRGVNGGIFVFLCGGGDKPACPGQGGTVTGTIDPGDILGIPSQGLTPGDFGGALRILRAGVAYVNVHTTTFPAGEIRGQVR